MTRDAMTLVDEALALPDNERVLVAAELLASVSDPAQAYSRACANDFGRELGQRIDRIAAGRSDGIDYESAQQLLDRDLAAG